MKAIKEQIAVMQHFLNGGTIEISKIDSNVWYDELEPKWNWINCDYRIKEQKKTVAIEKWLNEDGRCIEIQKGKLDMPTTSIKIGSYEVEL